ncbi:hypothetical protein NDN08_002290 [Rhodosorus marinus]|uniref:Cilium assembly protein DZIP1 N-terminal domain-containing protein n=1 Tax=Rhodosorus marinus TaxID=101924 RepID=A0AAV8UTA2_9RHOD|nr:hypothetical protein NDN08_002290 [Rhodosorus marinus]
MFGYKQHQKDGFEDIERLFESLSKRDSKQKLRVSVDAEILERVNMLLESANFKTKLSWGKADESLQASLQVLRSSISSVRRSEVVLEQSLGQSKRLEQEVSHSKRTLENLERDHRNADAKAAALEKQLAEMRATNEATLEQLRSDATELRVSRAQLIQKEKQIYQDAKAMEHKKNAETNMLRALSNRQCDGSGRPIIKQSRPLGSVRSATIKDQLESDVIDQLKANEEELHEENEDLESLLSRMESLATRARLVSKAANKPSEVE